MTNPIAVMGDRADTPAPVAGGPPPDAGVPGSDGPNPPNGPAAQDHFARLRRRTEDEIRRLVIDYHARLPRDRAIALGAAYARFSSRYQDSVIDQVRRVPIAEIVRRLNADPADPDHRLSLPTVTDPRPDGDRP